MKKIIEFKLKSPVKLVNMVGDTDVRIVTNGEVMIIDNLISEHRERMVKLCETKHAVLTQSPGGLRRTVKINLPTEKMSCEEVIRQVMILFDVYLGDCHVSFP